MYIHTRIYIYIVCTYIHNYIYTYTYVQTQGVPTMMGGMKSKKHAKNVFRTALAITLSIYLALCFSTNYYFGPKIVSIITLNWQVFIHEYLFICQS